MPAMPRPSAEAEKIHQKVMPFSEKNSRKESEKKRQKEDRQITFDIQQNISR